MPGSNTSITTEYRDGILIPVSLAAAAVVLMGTFAVVGADGYAVASANVGAADQTCIGIWESDAENLGAAGAVQGVVRRNMCFQLLVHSWALTLKTLHMFGWRSFNEIYI